MYIGRTCIDKAKRTTETTVDSGQLRVGWDGLIGGGLIRRVRRV